MKTSSNKVDAKVTTVGNLFVGNLMKNQSKGEVVNAKTEVVQSSIKSIEDSTKDEDPINPTSNQGTSKTHNNTIENFTQERILRDATSNEPEWMSAIHSIVPTLVPYVKEYETRMKQYNERPSIATGSMMESAMTTLHKEMGKAALLIASQYLMTSEEAYTLISNELNKGAKNGSFQELI